MNRQLCFSAGIVALAISLDGCRTNPSVPVAQAPAASSCAIAEWLPICDFDIRKRFPEISQTDKILDKDFDNSAEPVTAAVTYTPEVVGPHVVKTKTVVCTQSEGEETFHCQLARREGYYDTDPSLYILAGKSVDPGTAEKVIRLWMQGKLVAEQEQWTHLPTKDSRSYTLNYELHGVYTLDFHSSGCNGPVYIRIEGEGNAERLRIIKPPEVMCV